MNDKHNLLTKTALLSIEQSKKIIELKEKLDKLTIVLEGMINVMEKQEADIKKLARCVRSLAVPSHN